MLARHDPEELIRRLQEEERARSRGRLKIFLGYSSRVGKSLRMFDEGRRRAGRGQDVVVGATQSSGPADPLRLLAGLERIPMAPGPAVDLAAILRRRPGLCLIDGLAYANPPGARHRQRWEDAAFLLESGISVAACLNLQFIAECQPQVAALTGSSAARPLVPLRFLHAADEIEIVDAPPPAAGPGSVAPLEALREAALLLAADAVDQQLAAYLRRHNFETAGWGAQERILVCLGAEPAIAMIASARRNADRFHAELLAVAFDGAADPAGLARNVAAASAAGARILALDGSERVLALLRLAQEQGVTQIFLARPPSRRSWCRPWTWSPSPHERFLRRAAGVDLRLYPHRPEAGSDGA